MVPTCQVPPEGWFCTRESGHEGPCAAWPEERFTRIEVIDHTKKGNGRDFVRYYDSEVAITASDQDEGRTLKIFIEDKNEHIQKGNTTPS